MVSFDFFGLVYLVWFVRYLVLDCVRSDLRLSERFEVQALYAVATTGRDVVRIHLARILSLMNQGQGQIKKNTLFQLQIREITSDSSSASLGVCFIAQCVRSNAVVSCTIGKSTGAEAKVVYERIVQAYQARGRDAGIVEVRVVKQCGDGSVAVDLALSTDGQNGASLQSVDPPPAKRRRYYK